MINPKTIACEGASQPIGTAVVGESRTGKSHVREESLVRHKKSRRSGGVDTPILRVRTSSKQTAKSFVEIMLRAMEVPNSNAGTENAKTMRLHTLMINAGVKMIMIDEFQHLYCSRRTPQMLGGDND